MHPQALHTVVTTFTSMGLSSKCITVGREDDVKVPLSPHETHAASSGRRERTPSSMSRSSSSRRSASAAAAAFALASSNSLSYFFIVEATAASLTPSSPEVGAARQATRKGVRRLASKGSSIGGSSMSGRGCDVVEGSGG